jgi:hypothetical protein
MDNDKGIMSMAIIILLISVLSTGFLLYSNERLRSNIDNLQSYTNVLNSEIIDLRVQLNYLDINYISENQVFGEGVRSLSNNLFNIQGNISKTQKEMDYIKYCAYKYNDEDEVEEFIDCINNKLN